MADANSVLQDLDEILAIIAVTEMNTSPVHTPKYRAIKKFVDSAKIKLFGDMSGGARKAPAKKAAAKKSPVKK